MRNNKQGVLDVLGTLPIAAFVIDKDHKILHWNKSLELLTGLKAEVMLATKQHWKAFYKSERPCLADLLVNGKVEEIQNYYAGKYAKSDLLDDAYEATDFFPDLGDGGKWLRFTAAVIRDSLGTIVCVIETMEDVTKRKRAEEELSETRNYLESLITYANAPIIVWDPALKITRFNRAFEQLTGYSANEVLGQELCMLFHETSRGESMSKIAGKVSGEHWESIEIPILHKDGKVSIVLWNSANIYAEDGVMLLSTIAQGQDINEHIQARERLDHLNLILRTIRYVNQLVVREKNCAALLQKTCNILTEMRGYSTAWIVLLDEHGGFLDCFQSGLGKGFTSLLKELKRGDFPACVKLAQAQPGPVEITDPSSTCADCPIMGVYSDKGRTIIQLEHAGKVYGVLSVSVHTDFTVDDEELSLFEEVAGDIAFGLFNIELEEKRKRAEEKEQRHFQNTAFLTETAMQFVDFLPEKDIYRFIGEQMKELAGESIIVVNSIDQAKGILTTRAVVGMGKNSKNIIKLIGRNPVGMEYDANDEGLAYLSDGELHDYKEGLYGISLRTIPKPVCRAIEKLIRLNKIYSMGFVQHATLFGNAVIFLPQGIELENKETIKLFVKQASIAIQRKRSQTELQNTLEKLQKTIDGTIHTIAMTVEARDPPYTSGHQKRVADLTAAIASQMGLSDEKVEGIKMAGIIHDLGKIQVPAEILSKPGELSDIEFNMIKTHPQVGFDLLKGIEFPWPIAKMILQHHEKMNGSGYPQGLKGDEILLEARILAVADVVEAMSSHRPYRPALGIEKALKQIKKDKGTLFDPDVVDACLKIFEQGYKLLEG